MSLEENKSCTGMPMTQAESDSLLAGPSARVGLDVGVDEIVVSVDLDHGPFLYRYPNTPSGRQALRRDSRAWRNEAGRDLTFVGETGVYADVLTRDLPGELVLVSGNQVSAYRHALGIHDKDDAIDADLLRKLPIEGLSARLSRDDGWARDLGRAHDHMALAFRRSFRFWAIDLEVGYGVTAYGIRSELRRRFWLLAVSHSASGRLCIDDAALRSWVGPAHVHHAEKIIEEMRRVEMGIPGALESRLAHRLALAARQLLSADDERRELAARLFDRARIGQAAMLVTSVSGLGAVRGVRVSDEIGAIDRFASADALQSYAGLVPAKEVRHQSGRRAGIRRMRHGNPYLRRHLLQCVPGCLRYQPDLQEFARRLVRRGKAPGVVRMACARKIGRAIFAVLTSADAPRASGI